MNRLAATRHRATRNCLIVFAIVLFFLVPARFARAQAQITSIDNGSLTLSIGAQDGLRVGMTGVVKKERIIFRSKRIVDIARIEVTAVDTATSTARIVRLEPGWDVEVGLTVVFKQLQRRATPLPIAPSPTPVPVHKKSLADRVEITRQELETSEIDRQSTARKKAAGLLEKGDFEGARPWLQILLEEDREDSLVWRAIGNQRRLAEQAYEKDERERALALCKQILLLINDPETLELAQTIMVDEIATDYAPTVEAARSLLEELETINNRPMNAVTPEDRLHDLLVRRAAVLKSVTDALHDARGPIVLELRDLARRLVGSATIAVEGGTFLMGCTDGDSRCQEDEKPAHLVTLEPYVLDMTEVTIPQFRAFAAVTGSFFSANTIYEQTVLHPVVNVTWIDAQQYCSWIGGRLPTEAEWEMAARAGAEDRRYPRGSHIDHADANYSGVRGRDRWEYASPVLSFPANNWGFYDLLGNVWEWCDDSYTPDYRRGAAYKERDAAFEIVKVVRGGSWLAEESHLRFSSRMWFPAIRNMFNIGFRCVHEQPSTPQNAEEAS